MPTKLRPSIVTNTRGERSVTHYYIKTISVKDLKDAAASSDKKMAAKARKELARRGVEV